ncbi:hypothetical protein RHGRI_029690 [Rhododendron griersonianum]|uniref:Uncharacterized protein n=1 Tax=Rhododendron griersonianum TaxID=479676 RepID=A0AAV6IMK2_9ERIC|nr:hypothetical protein RHGRI_029690 [Rhododendron griersonianum]
MKANNGLAVKTPMNHMTGIQISWRDVLVSPAPAYWKAPECKLLAVSPELLIGRLQSASSWLSCQKCLLIGRLQSESFWLSCHELKQTIALRYSKRLKALKE